MRWFIVVDCAEKLQRFPNPRIAHAWADANALRNEKHLTENVVNLSPGLVFQAEVEDGIGISERVH
jgi:hypothetical protein